MPTPAHTLVTWSGVFGTPAAPIEIWQMSLKLGEGVFANQAARLATADRMAAAWRDTLRLKCLPIVSLTRTRVAQVSAEGLVTKDEEGTYNQADSVTVATGNSAGSTMPLQTSLCISLVTARSGPSGKGRFYLPAPGASLGADTRMSQADTASFATSAKAFLVAVDAAWTATPGPTSIGGNVGVYSTKGFVSPVTGVRVGRVLDTQRRRRGDLVEEYVALSIP